MQRLNIEVSYALWRLVQVHRERGSLGTWQLLTKAYHSLPRAHQGVRRDRQQERALLAALYEGKRALGRETERGAAAREAAAATAASALQAPAAPGGSPTSLDASNPAALVDRHLANILASHLWRNTSVEGVHSGRRPPHPLCPHQQRFTGPERQRLLREVASGLGVVLYWFDAVFSAQYAAPDWPHWPWTAAALATHLYSGWSTHWSLTASSAPVDLDTWEPPQES